MPDEQPIRIISTTLTRRDAAWYFSLPRPMTGWRALAFYTWLASSGGVLAALPHEWTKPEGSIQFVAIGVGLFALSYGLAAIWFTARMRFRAWRHTPRPVTLRVEQWPDHLSVEENGRKRKVSLDAITKVWRGKWHIFVESSEAVVMLPRPAFADPADAEAMASELEPRK